MEQRQKTEDKFYYHILFTSGTDLSVITKRLKLFEIVRTLIRAPSYINRRTDGYVYERSPIPPTDSATSGTMPD